MLGLNPEQNSRASKLVITSIGQYPQSWQNQFIIADALLQEFNPEALYRETGVGIREIAQIQPDGDANAAIINDIHTRFNIARRVTPAEGIDFVMRGIGFALECLRTQVRASSHQLGFALPEHYLSLRPMTALPLGHPSGRAWEFDQTFAASLQTLLSTQPALCEAVSVEISRQAQEIRAQSKIQQTHAQQVIAPQKEAARRLKAIELTPAPTQAGRTRLQRLGLAVGLLLGR